MTLEELIEKLKALQNADPEQAHLDADRLLLEYIGSADVDDAFTAIPKWYA